LDQSSDFVIEKTIESWEQWGEGLEERLAEKREHWSSEHSAIWNRDQLIADYAKQFNNDLSKELDSWIENQFKQVVLQPSLDHLDEEIQKELKAIQAGIEDIDVLKKDQSCKWVFYKEGNSALGDFGFMGNLGLAGLGVAVFVPALILAGPILFTIGSLVAGGLFGTGVVGVLDLDTDIRAKVFDNGCEQFDKSLTQTLENLDAIIGAAFSERLERVDEIVSRAISTYENLLEQQEENHQKNRAQREAEKAWIAQKYLELERLKNDAEVVFTAEGILQ